MTNVTYTGVDDCNLDALALDALLMKFVDLGHHMRCEVSDRAITLILTLLKVARLDVWLADPLNVGLGNAVRLQGPDILDGGVRFGNSHDCVFSFVDVVYDDRDALEELVVELHADLAVALDVRGDLCSILRTKVSIALLGLQLQDTN